MCNILKRLRVLEGYAEEQDLSTSECLEIYKTIHRFLKSITKPEDKLLAYDYLLFIFRSEFVAKTRTRLFRFKSPEPLIWSLPSAYYASDGTQLHLTCVGRREIQLNENTAVVAWKSERLRRILPVVAKNRFAEDRDNHAAHYYLELDLLVVLNGNHSASAGVFCKSGSVHADIYSLVDIFAHVKFDGRNNWVNMHTGEQLQEVSERYIALLYDIAQQKYKYQKLLENPKYQAKIANKYYKPYPLD